MSKSPEPENPAPVDRKAMIKAWHDCKDLAARKEFVKNNPAIADIYDYANQILQTLKK